MDNLPILTIVLERLDKSTDNRGITCGICLIRYHKWKRLALPLPPRGPPMLGTELEELTFRHVPEGFFRKAFDAIYKAHEGAFTYCRNSFADAEAENLLPFHRRAKVESNLHAVTELFVDLTSASVKAEEGWWSHVEVRSGPVVLTASAVPEPCGPVRSSKFRQTLARDNQGVLFDEDPVPDDAPLYVLLLHSRYVPADRKDWLSHGHLPGSVYVAWPTPDLRYVHTVNLFERFPEVVEANVPREWNEEARLRYIGRSLRQYGT